MSESFQLPGAAGPTSEPIVAARFPATANQHLHWREAIAFPGNAAQNIIFRRRLSGPVRDAAIVSALRRLVERHEILRTQFREAEDGQLVQEVLESLNFKPDFIDLRPLDDDTRQRELAKLGMAEARKPFVFVPGCSQGPLFRVLMVRVGADEAYLHLTFHKLVIDGWSIDLLMREFGDLAAAADAGHSLEQPAVAMQFGDYARWQADLLASSTLDSDRIYWKTRLKDLPDFTVTPDRPGDGRGQASTIHSILLPRDVTDPFEKAARESGRTLFSFAAAAVISALHLMTDEPEIVVGTQVAGRDDPDSEAIIGPVVNTVLLRVPIAAEASFAALAQQIQGEMSEALAHQHLPYAEIAEVARAHRGSGTPAYRVNFTVQKTNIATGSIEDRCHGNFAIESVASPSTCASWDLNLFMVSRREGWRLSCEYPPELYDEATIISLLHAWRAAIEGAVTQPTRILSDRTDLVPLPRQRRETSSRPPAPPKSNPRRDALMARILPLQAKGGRTPVIAINNASVLFPVAKAVGEDRPFIDIQFCPSQTPIDLPRRHFTDHARDAVELIRLAQAHGPYVLFGHCVFGAIAIEAARILQSEGETVELVVLNDTYRPGFRERLGFVDRTIRAWQSRRLAIGRLLQRVNAGELTWAQFVDNFAIARRLGLAGLIAGMSGQSGNQRRDAMTDGNRWFAESVLLPSQADLDMTPYRGRVILFRSVELQERRLFPRDFGWTAYVDGPFEVVDCPGSHDTMFRREGAQVIAERINAILAETGN